MRRPKLEVGSIGDSAMLAEPSDRFRSLTAFSTSSGFLVVLACFSFCSRVFLKADLGDGLVGVDDLRISPGVLNPTLGDFPEGWNVNMVCGS